MEIDVSEYGYKFPCTDEMVERVEYVPVGSSVYVGFLMDLLSFALSNKDTKAEDVIVHDGVMYISKFVLDEMGRQDLIETGGDV